MDRSPPRLPHGVRDHLPEEATRRARLRLAVGAAFQRAGYRAVETPLYERDEVFALGAAHGALGATPPPAVRFSDPRPSDLGGQVVALRVDFTPQIARLWASRLQDSAAGSARLRYEGAVVRLGEALAGTPSELYQLGVELIGEAAPAGDLELLRLLRAALGRVGLDGACRIDLGHAGFVRRALWPVLPRLEDTRPLLEALRHADERAVAAAVAPLGDARARRLVSALPSLRGDTAVLAEARRLCAHDRAARTAVDELAAIARALPGPSIDLGEVRGLGYYTGTRFSAYAPGVGRAIAVGGRYDELLARFGRPAPAAGFAIELDALDEATRPDARRGARVRKRIEA